MNDTLQRFLFERLAIRGELVHLDASWQAVLERHPYPSRVRDVLGEAIAASVLLAATLKFEGSLILQVQGNGPVSLLVVETTSARTIRAVAHWEGEVPEGSLRDAFGDARLVITIEPDSGERYQGIVELVGDHLSHALEHYLERSEQLPTTLLVAADANIAAGLLVQKLPGEDAEDQDAWNRIATLAATLTPEELLGLEQGEVIRRLFHEEDVRLFESEPVSFRCSCSRDRVANALRSIGREEVRSIISDEGVVAVTCEFCNMRYDFDAVDAEQLFSEQPQPEVRPTRH